MEFSSIELVRQGKNGPLSYMFENAKCQMVDVMERQYQRQLVEEGERMQDMNDGEIIIID